MNNKTPLANHTLQRFVATFSLTVVAFIVSACASPTTPAPTPIPIVNPTVPVAQTSPTPGLIQNPIIRQPIIAPVIELPGTGGSTQPAGSSAISTAPPPLGQPQNFGDLSIQPSELGWQTQLGKEVPQAGNVYLTITVTIQNNSSTDSFQFDPTQFLLVGPNGQAFQLVTLASVENELQAVTLNPGDKTQGMAIFEVSQGQEQAKWSLQFRGVGQAPLTWSLIG
jgi:Domain of unknown function (DUF4352)